MGRAREFEDEQAVERAMKLFWEKGYEHSSLKELLATMGILNGSFYHSFGNKKNLFIKTLEAYYEDLALRRGRLFQTTASFQEKIRAVFHYSLARQKRKDCPRGCFLVNSLSADVLENEDIRRFVISCVDDFENFLSEQIKLAVANGELDPSIDPRKTAAVVNVYLQGLLKLCVLEFHEKKFQEQTDYFLAALGL